MRQNLHQITEGGKLAVMLMSGSSQPERLCLHIIKSVCVFTSEFNGIFFCI